MSVPGYLSPTSGGSRLLRTIRHLGDPSLRVTSAGPGYLLVYDGAGRTEHPYVVDRAEVDAWASRTPLAWVSPTEAYGTIEVPRGQFVYYKYTRGGWDTVEKWPDCVEAGNRYELGRAQEKRDTVYGWRDQCPE
jgi:hypothetical protein